MGDRPFELLKLDKSIMVNSLGNDISRLEELLISKLLQNFGHEVFTPGLDRTKPLYAPYVDWVEKNNIPVVTIAGTNGKGETALSFEWLLNQQGYFSALWTSPHIETITERFSFSSSNVSLADLAAVIEDEIIEIHKWDFKISFYEFLFNVFLKMGHGYYQKLSSEEKKKFVLILEVGLGGRLDAVNHFCADIVLLTSVSRDHREILGNTYAEILREKCGVLRSNQVLISALELKYLREQLNDICKNYPVINWLDLFDGNYLEKSSDFSMRNRTLAHRGLEALFQRLQTNVPVKSMTQLMANWPLFKGRSEVFQLNKKKFIFIGAHNVDGMRKLIERYHHLNDRPYSFLSSFSKRDRKEVELMLKMLCSLGRKCVVTTFLHPKAYQAEELEVLVENLSEVTFKKSWKEFLKEVNEEKYDSEIIVTGSYYFIGEVQRYLKSLN